MQESLANPLRGVLRSYEGIFSKSLRGGLRNYEGFLNKSLRRLGNGVGILSKSLRGAYGMMKESSANP